MEDHAAKIDVEFRLEGAICPPDTKSSYTVWIQEKHKFAVSELKDSLGE